VKNEEYYIESMMKEHLTYNKNGGRLNGLVTSIVDTALQNMLLKER
jgi:hypothetical protein